MVGFEVMPRTPSAISFGEPPSAQMSACEIVEPGALTLVCVKEVKLRHPELPMLDVGDASVGTRSSSEMSRSVRRSSGT